MANGSSKDTAAGSRWRRYSKGIALRRRSRSCAAQTRQQQCGVRERSPGKQERTEAEEPRTLALKKLKPYVTHLADSLARLASSPGAKVSDFPLVGEGQRFSKGSDAGWP